METVDVQPTTGKKSPRLAAVARSLFQGDIGQSSSSSYDFQSCRQEQESRTNVNNLGISSSNNSVRQQHHAVDVGGVHLPSTMRFEQQAEQLLQQDQALQMDQILDLLGLLLKQQRPAMERETNISLQQQEYPSLTAAIEAQRQNDRGLSTTNTKFEPAAATTRHWVNTEELSHGKTRICAPGDSLTDAAAAHELLRRSRDTSNSVLKCPEQQQQELMNLHAAAIVAAATATDASHPPNSSPSRVSDGESSSPHVYVEGKQQQEKHFASGGSTDWTGNSSQPPSCAMALAAAAATESVAFREAGSDSICHSYASSTYGCRGGQQQPKSGSSSPAWMPFRLGSAIADPLAIPTETGTSLRDARQLQRLQVQQHLIQQQQPMEQQQFQLQQHMRSQQYLMERHHLLHPQHLQHVQPQELSGQRLLQELQQHSQQQSTEVQMQRGEAEENILNDDTRHFLSKSLDVLMGDANIQALKDLLIRRTPTTAVGSGSGRDCRGNIETSYGSPTHATPGGATGFDAALFSLLQQQHGQQQHRQQQHSQQLSKGEGEVLLNRSFPDESNCEPRIVQEKKQFCKGGNEADMPLFDSTSHPSAPPAASVTTRGRSCISKGAEDNVHVTRAGQARQQEHPRRVRHMPQEQQRLQQQEAEAAFQTSSVTCLPAGFERTSSCQSLRSPATQKIKNEGLNTKRSAAAEGAAAAFGNARGGAAQRLQQQQQAEKKRGRVTRSFSPNADREQERQSPLNARESSGRGGGPTAGYGFTSDNILSEQVEQGSYREAVRNARLYPATTAHEESFFETSEDSPHSAELTRASLLKKNMCPTVGAATGEGTGRRSSVVEERVEGFTVSPAPQEQEQSAGAAASTSRVQEERSGDAICCLNSISDRSSEDAARTPAEKRMEADHLSDTDKQQIGNRTAGRTGAARESGETETIRARRSSTIPAYCGGRRRVQEPCELALAAARLEQQGHTFTPPFYLRTTPAVATSSGSSRCGSTRENCKRSEAAAGAEAKRERNYDRDAGEGARSGATRSQGKTANPHEAEEERREEEEEEDVEGESLTQQQLTLLKHIYAVLSQAEEYFSFKSALYQLQIKRHLKKCVSSLAAAAASNGTSRDKDNSPHTAAGGNKHHRSLPHSGNSPSKAIRLFTSMPPIPINVVEQRALLSVRKHLQAGGGGGLLSQGDGFAQLLMEELDELLTSLVNKLLLIIVVKFQTCFIHAPARAQLREFLVSFVFPGDMATQLLFRDHVQAVVHARIRHFRDSVGRTLRHQPPPSPPLSAASVPRGGTKRSNRAAAGSASSPASRETEEEGDDEEERQKKQKVCEVFADFQERDSGNRLATTGAPAARGLSNCGDKRRPSPASAASSSVIQNSSSASEIASHSATARTAAMQLENGQGRQSSSINDNEKKGLPASRSPRNKDAHRDQFPNSGGDAKQVVQYPGGCGSGRSVHPGRDGGGGRSSRASEHASATVVANAAGTLGTAQRKGTAGGAGGSTVTSGSGSGSRTRGRLHSRRKRRASAANTGAETRSPSASSSRYGPAAATRRSGGCAPATEKTSNETAYEGAANHQQQCLREAGSTARRGGVTGGRTAAKTASGALTPAQRNQLYKSGSAGEDLRQDDYSSSDGQKPEAQHGERFTRAGALADVYMGRTSLATAQPQSFSQATASPQRHHSALQQQQCCSTDKRGEVGTRWGSANEKAESCDRGHSGSASVADGTVDLTGSRNSVLSRGSTRESAGDPLAWDQVDALHCKSSTGQRVLPSPIHMTQKASCRDSLDADDVNTTKGSAGQRTSAGETRQWTTSRSNIEEDEATQALAAALGGALDPSNGDSAAVAGEVWEWLAVAAASKDEQQQEKFKQTLETLLNAWTTSGSNENRTLRGMQDSELASNNGRNTLGGSCGSNNSASDGWFNFAGGVLPSTRDKKSRPNQADELNLDPFDATNNAMHFSGGGMRGKDASLPSPSSIKGPPSEASTSLPPHEERTPPAERSTAASADPDATHSLVATENSPPRRDSTMCLPDGSLRTGRASTAGERGTKAPRGPAPVITAEREGGAVGSLRLPLPREINRTQGTAYQKEMSALDNISHSTIADFLLTYCKDDVSAYEVAAQLRHRETGTPAATLTSSTGALGTSHDGVQAEAYDSSLPEKLMNSFSLTPAEQITKNSTANNIELPALLAEALSASHTGGNSLAFSLSSLLASSSPLPS